MSILTFDTPRDDLLELQNTVNNLILDDSIGRTAVKSPQTSIRALSQQRQPPERSIKIPPSKDGVKSEGSVRHKVTPNIVKPASVTPQLISQKLSQINWVGEPSQTITKIGDEINNLTGRQTSRIVMMSLNRYDSLLRQRNAEHLKQQQQQITTEVTTISNTLQQQMELQLSESSKRMTIAERESNHRLYYFRKMKQFETRYATQRAERKVRSAAAQLSELKNQMAGMVDTFREVVTSKKVQSEDALTASRQSEAALISVLQETLALKVESLDAITLSKQPSSSSRHFSDISTPTDMLQSTFPSSVGYPRSPSEVHLEARSPSPLSSSTRTVTAVQSLMDHPVRCFGVLS